MAEKGCVSTSLPLQCKRHTNESIKEVKDGKELEGIVKAPTTLCCCGEMFSCNIHKCTQPCFVNHSHVTCTALVKFKFPMEKCPPQHVNQKSCFEDADKLKCTTEVPMTFSKCGHSGTRLCSQEDTEVTCKEKVSYSFPQCGHQASKVCSDPISEKCLQRIPFIKEECQHQATRRCYQKESDVACREMVSYVFPDCGHSSQKKKACSQVITWHCGECDKARKAHIKDLENKLKKSDGFRRTDLDQKTPEYLKISDAVMRSIVPVHNWNPVITRIEKVTNWKLEKKYEEARGRLNGNFEDRKFHGTGDDGVVGITKDGFRLPKDPGMYGAGIYFATDSSKSAQEIYTKGSNKLLVCKVLLGKSMNVAGANKGLNLQELRNKGYDSAFAPRNSKQTNGVMNDEFIIYDPDQAKVEYIVHYTLGGRPRLPASLSSAMPVFTKKTITSAELRTLKPNDPFFMAAWHADSHFHKMASLARLNVQVKSITVIQNPKLQAAFENRRQNFLAKGIPADYIYAFHGTKNDPAVMDNILQNNFDMKYAKRQAHGPGHYFSEFPDVSLGYGPGLIFCQLLSGKEYKGSNQLWPGFNSKVMPK